MKRAAFLLAAILSASAIAQAQTTIYWKRDTIYAGPGGGAIATVTPAPSDTTAPGAPSGLGATSTTATSVTLSWTGSSDSGGSNLAGYKIYRQKGSGASLPVGTVGTSGTTCPASGGPSFPCFLDQPLEPSTSYTYTIVAFDNAQNHSSASGSVNPTTSAVSTDNQAPSAPLQLTGMVMSSTSVQLNWLAATDAGGSGIGSYQVKRGGSVIATVGSTTLGHLDTTVSANTSYTYTVVARDNVSPTPLVSSDSNSLTLNTGQEVIPPSKPASFTGTGLSSTSVRLTWSASTDTGGSGLAGYRVYYGTTMVSGTNPVTSTTMDFTGLTPVTTYSNITIKAVDNAGNFSLAAGPIAIATLPDTTPPNAPEPSGEYSGGWVTLTWAAVTDVGGSGIAGYKVYYVSAAFGMEYESASDLITGTEWGTMYGDMTGFVAWRVRAIDNAGNISAAGVWDVPAP